MSQLRVDCFAMSLDGFVAGPDQSLEHPLGVGGAALHEWSFRTRTFRRHVLGEDGGEQGVDDRFIAGGFDNVGAWIIGRNMFGPVRGPWPDEDWKGWWGEVPPFHCDVFVLTHHARAPVPMQGGTTFHFITGGIHDALARARAVAGDRDIRLGGGAATVRQYLQARLVDRLHVPLVPVLLGAGESLFAGLDLPVLGYECTERVEGEHTTHLVIRRRNA